jgi:hypothetical protein
MKRTFLAFAMLALILPALPRAKGADVSVDFFYNNLSGGNWIEVADYGYGWQPDVAVNDPNWRPYADGYWAYTDEGWTWVSYEDFGWATYHYGRWARLADTGWIWFPGSDLDWGPAWVSWRTGGDYVGWAPLPPRGPGIAYEGQPIGGQVDVEFDIGPAYYNFIDARFIGEPVLRDRIFAPSQNVTYINETVNVTNISVQNNVVYNYGPDYNVLSARSSRPIQRLNIERQANVNLSAAAKSGGLTKVQGDKLIVGAPNKINKPAQGIAPPRVKTKVAQPKVEHGWSGVPNEAQLKQKMKTENPKNIPPPTGGAAPGRAAGAVSPAVAATPTATVAPATSPAPFEKGKGKGRPGERVQPGLTAAPAASPAGTSPAPIERGKGKGKAGERPQPGATGVPAGSPAGAVSPAIQGSPPETQRGKPGKGKRGELGPTPPEQTGAAPLAPEATQPTGKHKGQFERGVSAPTPSQPGGAANIPEQGKHRGRGPEEAGSPAGGGAVPSEGKGRGPKGQGAYAQPGTPPATGAAPETRGGKQKGQGAYGQPGGAPAGGTPAGAEHGQGKPAGGKKKGEKVSPTPGPQ